MTFTGRVPYEQAARYLRVGDIALAPEVVFDRRRGQDSELHGLRAAHGGLRYAAGA